MDLDVVSDLEPNVFCDFDRNSYSNNNIFINSHTHIDFFLHHNLDTHPHDVTKHDRYGDN